MFHSEHNYFVIKLEINVIHRNEFMKKLAILQKITKKFRKQNKTKNILKEFHLNVDVVEISIFKSRDIYNEIACLRAQKLNVYTFIQALMITLFESNKWYVNYQNKNDDNKLKYFFFISEASQKLLRENFEIILINCIYKINKYKMSLLIFLEVNFLNINFYANFCFMKNEIINDYT